MASEEPVVAVPTALWCVGACQSSDKMEMPTAHESIIIGKSKCGLLTAGVNVLSDRILVLINQILRNVLHHKLVGNG